MNLKHWAAFLLAGLIWGSSFLWIKIAVAEIGPFTLVAFRLLFGLLGLLAVMFWQKKAFPKNRKLLFAFLFMAVVNTALPFTLISWGETKIDSALAAILDATVPLFTIIIAHFWLHDEKITFARIVGLIVGFFGVVTLLSKDLNLANLGSVWGQLAVVAASACYATAITFSRKHLRNQSPVVQTTMFVLMADALMWLTVPFVEMPIHLPTLPITWIALVWLGLLGTCAAYLLFFYVISVWGPTRASLVSYLFPIIGLVLGVIFLGEKINWNLIVGSFMIISGIVAVNYKELTQKSI